MSNFDLKTLSLYLFFSQSNLHWQQGLNGLPPGFQTCCCFRVCVGPRFIAQENFFSFWIWFNSKKIYLKFSSFELVNVGTHLIETKKRNPASLNLRIEILVINNQRNTQHIETGIHIYLVIFWFMARTK